MYVLYRPNLIVRKSLLLDQWMAERTCSLWTLVTLPNSWLLPTSVANGIINAKNNEHLESRIETSPTEQSLLTEGDQRKIYGGWWDKCNRSQRCFWKRANTRFCQRRQMDSRDEMDVAFITYISTSVHECDVREIQIVREVRDTPWEWMFSSSSTGDESPEMGSFVIGKYCRVDSWSYVHSIRTGSRPNVKRGCENESHPCQSLATWCWASLSCGATKRFIIRMWLHCISQNGNLLFTSLVCSWSWLLPPSLFGLPASSTEPPPLPWGHIDCHLSARVDIIGGRDGLLSRILSISLIMFAFNFGISWKLHIFLLFVIAFGSWLDRVKSDHIFY